MSNVQNGIKINEIEIEKKRLYRRFVKITIDLGSVNFYTLEQAFANFRANKPFKNLLSDRLLWSFQFILRF